ncbi:septum site-determining protein MinC [Salipiger mucosus]|uniref:Probable septum site-determining protein MinC n=1 Tax=Salipiger mucosus DSM 16094 TaxID=1123237 RepID=S9QS57_9RHOB|nr:septum site-determining protein MinC [Salipiger mucosus]EPX82498.1 Septum site-determining protein MinC [Salipiger mucosus DSM 16094]
MQANVASGRGDSVVSTVKPIQFRGRFLTAVAVRVSGPPDDDFVEFLDFRLDQTPNFFVDAPVVLDLALAEDRVGPDDVRRLIETLRARKLAVFGVQGASEAQRIQAEAMGLITVTGGRDAPLRSTERQTRSAAPAKAPVLKNRIITRPVRSGQMVVAEDGDLTVIGPVSSGAELVARGSIHVYGRLRGRAMAGAHGDETARIFCQNLDAELLAVAGLYRTSENLGDAHRNQPVQVFLEDERLRVEPL